ncbi:MAG: hypothetical protein AB1295_04595 [Candidatus Micrarchaeota archaeon]
MGNNKVLLGGLALLALLGAAFAWGGFSGHFADSLPDDVKVQLKQALEERDLETIHAIRQEYAPADGPLSQLTDEQRAELDSLREQIRAARESGDSETAEELRSQMRELLPEPPEGFGQKGPRAGRMRGFGMRGPGPMGLQNGTAPGCDCPCMQE